MDLKKIFPFSYKVTDDPKTLVIAIAIYLIVSIVLGGLLGILGSIPVVGILTGIVGAVVWIYSIVGIVISILEFLNAKK